jgi:hypothetical protein
MQPFNDSKYNGCVGCTNLSCFSPNAWITFSIHLVLRRFRSTAPNNKSHASYETTHYGNFSFCRTWLRSAGNELTFQVFTPERTFESTELWNLNESLTRKSEGEWYRGRGKRPREGAWVSVLDGTVHLQRYGLRFVSVSFEHFGHFETLMV